MRVFITWSGEVSHAAALALHDWLPFIFSDLKPFVSSEDIRKGERWQDEIGKQLSVTNFGIICVTPDNMQAPWLLFEAGALSKLKKSKVVPVLFGDMHTGDIEKGPLTQFQASVFSKADILKLLKSINSTIGKGKLEEPRLIKMFEKWWGELENNISKALKKNPDAQQSKHRPEKEILLEILENTRAIAQRVPSYEAEEMRKLRRLLLMSVKELDLSPRVLAVLEKAGVHNIAAFSSMAEEDFLKCGTSSTLKEARNALSQLGLSFGMTFDPIVFQENC